MIRLFSNHLDAWGMTFSIASTAVILHNAISFQSALLIVAITAAYWLGFAANDYFDAPYDRHDEKKARRNFFVNTAAQPRTLYIAAGLVLTFVALVFLSFGVKGLGVLIPAYFILWAYSAPPFRLKSRPGFDVLTHTIFVNTFPYLTTIYLLDVTWTSVDRVLLAIFIVGSFCGQIEQQLRDFEVDSLTDRNFTIVLGRRVTTLILRAFTGLLVLIGALAIVGGIVPVFLMPFALIVLPLLIHRLVRSAHTPRSERFVFAGISVMLAYVALMWVWVLIYSAG